MLKNTTVAIYQPLMPEGLFIIHKKLFPLRTGQHLSCKGGEKNQKKWQPFGNTCSSRRKKSRKMASLAPANKKNQKKNGNLSATLVHQNAKNQLLIKMQRCTFYEHLVLSGNTLLVPQLSWRSNTYPFGAADNRKLS